MTPDQWTTLADAIKAGEFGSAVPGPSSTSSRRWWRNAATQAPIERYRAVGGTAFGLEFQWASQAPPGSSVAGLLITGPADQRA
ncbi:hypothetical protein ABZ678_10820 [Streptomyces hirsutus]|uniref:hypothetical protein n=1 Tax=Streptomyces hirsutus TaxID=35620 RepID=UPI0033DAA9BF